MTNYILTRYHPTRTKNSQPQKTISFKKAAVMNLGTCLDCYFSKKSKKKKNNPLSQSHHRFMANRIFLIVSFVNHETEERSRCNSFLINNASLALNCKEFPIIHYSIIIPLFVLVHAVKFLNDQHCLHLLLKEHEIDEVNSSVSNYFKDGQCFKCQSQYGRKGEKK